MMNICRSSASKLSIFPKHIWIIVTGLATLLFPVSSLFGHEVWIEPHSAHIEEGQELVADLRIGDMFAGDHLIYIPQQTEMLAVITETGSFDLAPRIGSRPVIEVPPEKLEEASGHVIVVYESANSYVDYASEEKFFAFAEKKGAPDARQDHKRRRLPDSGFVERYRRFAKASITVGPETNMVNDRAMGMEVEFLLLAITPLSDGRLELEVQLLYQGMALPDAQATLFSRDPDGLVTKARLITGPQGLVSVTAVADHSYLLDHVTLREADPDRDRNRPVWESLWASLTFSGPKTR
jgi:hypothetical protein